MTATRNVYHEARATRRQDLRPPSSVVPPP